MLRVLLFTAGAFIVLSVALYSIRNPSYNWDILPYVASVYSLESGDTNLVHQKTYQAIRNSVSESTYQLLVSGNEYRKTMETCSGCFHQQMPFFKVKPLYIALAYVFYKSSFDISISTVIVSSISYVFIAIISFVWILGWSTQRTQLVIGFFTAIIIALSPFLTNTASMSTPDMLSSFISLLGIYFLLVKRNFYIFALSLMLSLFARPDNIIILILLLSALWLNKKEKSVTKRLELFIPLITAIICLKLIDALAGGYGWAALFEHSFSNKIINPADYNSQFSIGVYVNGLIKGLSLLRHSYLMFHILLFALIIYMKRDSLKKAKEDLTLLILFAVIASIVIHYLLYPIIDDRFFITQYLVIDFIFVKYFFTASAA